MLTFLRTPQILFGILLAALISSFSTGCTVYTHSATNPGNVIKMVRYYVLNEDFPADYAWLIDVDVLKQTGLEGSLFRLSPESAKMIVDGVPQNIDEVKKLQIVVLYVKNDHAIKLLDSTRIHLPFDQVTRSNLYEFSPKKSNTATGVLSGVVGPAVFIAIFGFVFSNG